MRLETVRSPLVEVSNASVTYSVDNISQTERIPELRAQRKAESSMDPQYVQKLETQQKLKSVLLSISVLLVDLESVSHIQSLLNELGISYSLERLAKIFLGKRDLQREFIELLELLTSKDLERKLHPEVLRAINESGRVNFILADGTRINFREFPSVKDFARRLVLDLLKALEDPNVISQRNKGTCAQTVVERALAERRPAEYVRLIRELITKGYYEKNGRRMEIDVGGIRKAPGEEDNRLLTTRILAPTFMEYANGNYDYDDDKDVSVSPDGRHRYRGSRSEPTMQFFFGGEVKPFFGPSYEVTYVRENVEGLSPSEKIELMKRIMAESGGYPVIICAYYGEGNTGRHAVELKSVSDSSITVSNPWGQVETYREDKDSAEIKPGGSNAPIKRSLSDFLKAIYAIVYPRIRSQQKKFWIPFQGTGVKALA